jgi:hypothetical protein
MNSIGIGNEWKIVNEDGVIRWALRIAEDADIELVRFDTDGVEQEDVLVIDSTTGNLALVSDLGITGSLSVSGENDVAYRALANDAACEIGRSDAGGVIELLNTTTGNKAITTDTSGANAVALGQEVTIFLTAATGNSYTLALSTGTLTFNAALECAKVVRTSLGWNVVSLNGATIV